MQVVCCVMYSAFHPLQPSEQAGHVQSVLAVTGTCMAHVLVVAELDSTFVGLSLAVVFVAQVPRAYTL